MAQHKRVVFGLRLEALGWPEEVRRAIFASPCQGAAPDRGALSPPCDVGDPEAVDRFLGDAGGPQRLRRRTGAYYTGRDIAAHICASTIIPRWLDQVAAAAPQAFEQAQPWALLHNQLVRYLHPAIRHGAGLPLPDQIAAGLVDASLRERWNAPAPADHALPGELWRDVVARYQRREELVTGMRQGALCSADDLVSANLDLPRYAQELISNCQTPALLLAMWRALLGLRILDPACGAGALLLGALGVLEPLYLACLDRMRDLCAWPDPAAQTLTEIMAQSNNGSSRSYHVRDTILGHNLYGVDLRAEAVEACCMRLCLALLEGQSPGPALPLSLHGLRAHLLVGDALSGGLSSHGGGYDVVLGNPPYVETRSLPSGGSLQRYATHRCGNLYAMVLERSLELLAQGGRLGMIVPLSLVCTDRMRPLQELLLRQSARLWFSSYDDRPARLFPELEHLRATIVLLRTPGVETSRQEVSAPYQSQVLCSDYRRWRSLYRPYLFQTLFYHEATGRLMPGAIPKIGHPLAASILDRLGELSPLEGALSGAKDGGSLYYHNAPQYWIRATDYVPYFWNQRDGEQPSRQVKPLGVRDPSDLLPTVALLNSSLFYWWFIVWGDGRHLNLREIRRFPAGLEHLTRDNRHALSLTTTRLMADLRKHARRKEAHYRATGWVRYDEFHPRHSKALIDQVDHILADHYGLSGEELDYILHYDLKFRMGLTAP